MPVSIEYNYQVEMNFIAEWKLELTQQTESVWNLSLHAIVPLYPEWQLHMYTSLLCVCGIELHTVNVDTWSGCHLSQPLYG